jgi:NADH-quinone oxidoreductase subunit J
VGERITFAIAAAVALGSAVGVVTLKNPFRAAVSLIGTLLAVAVMFLLLAAPFVAAIQVIVYAGAIVVLFLFVIAYLGERPVQFEQDPMARYEVVGWIAVIALGVQGFIALANSRLTGIFDDPKPTGDIGSPTAIGRAFTDPFIVSFEATSLVLLVAALGAVMLAKRAVLGEGGR